MAKTKNAPAEDAVDATGEGGDTATETKENPRTARSRERLELACTLIEDELKGGDWVSSNDIHRKLSGSISEGMFGRAKSQLGVVHRRVKGENGKPEYQWRLPEETPTA